MQTSLFKGIDSSETSAAVFESFSKQEFTKETSITLTVSG